MPIEINLPLSKSMALRAMVITAVRGGDLAALPTPCADAEILRRGLLTNSGRIDCELSGAASRFLLAYHACREGSDVMIDGSTRLRQRPIRPLVDLLRELGAEIEGSNLPLRVRGKKLKGTELHVDCSQSSQWASALMLVEPWIPGLKVVPSGQITSKGYLEMTKKMMKQLEPEIEADWSAAAPWYQYMVLGGKKVKLNGLRLPSCQGDSVLPEIFQDISQGHLQRDFSDTPDIVPSVVAACCGRGVPFELSGVANLRIKECDRLQATIEIMGQLGYRVETDGERMWYDGNSGTVTSLEVDSRGDHRMAMMAAAMVPVYPNIQVLNPEVVSKSYPTFWIDMAKVL